jgi:hypothetical protein
MKLDKQGLREAFERVLDEAESSALGDGNETVLNAIATLEKSREVANEIDFQDRYTQRVKEHHLELQADPLTMKIIAEATRQFLDDLGYENQTLYDFLYTMSARYQSFFELDQDFWDFTDDHKQLLGIKNNEK